MAEVKISFLMKYVNEHQETGDLMSTSDGYNHSYRCSNVCSLVEIQNKQRVLE